MHCVLHIESGFTCSTHRCKAFPSAVTDSKRHVAQVGTAPSCCDVLLTFSCVHVDTCAVRLQSGDLVNGGLQCRRKKQAWKRGLGTAVSQLNSVNERDLGASLALCWFKAEYAAIQIVWYSELYCPSTQQIIPSLLTRCPALVGSPHLGLVYITSIGIVLATQAAVWRAQGRGETERQTDGALLCHVSLLSRQLRCCM